MKLLSILVVMIACSSIAHSKKSCTEEEFARSIAKGFPVGTESIVRRIVQCNHWAGEIGDTDPERTKQINTGLKKSKCESLDKDRSEFVKQHVKNSNLQLIFAKSESWEGTCD